MSDETEPTTEATTETEAQPEPESFPRAYVEELRAEAAARRVEAVQARDELIVARADNLGLRVRDTARGVLEDPDDLLAFTSPADLTDDDGRPDAEKIAAAAAALVASKPHLAPRRTTTDVGAGPRGTTAPAAADSFADILRKAAR